MPMPKPEPAVDENGNMLRCEDRYVGIIEIRVNNRSGYVKWIENCLNDKEESKSETKGSKKFPELPTIIIVLESPHKKEYVGKNIAAKGITWQNISKFLCSSLLKYCLFQNEKCILAYTIDSRLTNGQYRVCIVNSIQYQCSLGTDLDGYKEKIFKKIWGFKPTECSNSSVGFGQNDFRNRFKKFLTYNNIVINACTGDVDEKEDLAYLVQQELDLFQCQAKLLTSAHPSSALFCDGLIDRCLKFEK